MAGSGSGLWHAITTAASVAVPILDQSERSVNPPLPQSPQNTGITCEGRSPSARTSSGSFLCWTAPSFWAESKRALSSSLSSPSLPDAPETVFVVNIGPLHNHDEATAIHGLLIGAAVPERADKE